MKYKCLTIAGFDNSGGAGLQADLKTFSALGCYGLTVATAVAVQNTQGVHCCYPLSPQVVEEQLEAVFDDIEPDAIKIGMLFNDEIVDTVTAFLRRRVARIPIVLDPVMVSKNGQNLLLLQSEKRLTVQLLPMASLVTPNLYEAYRLGGYGVANLSDLASRILDMGPGAVLIKGGHMEGNKANDLLVSQQGDYSWLISERIASANTHGTGCTLSSAIASYLAKNYALIQACRHAKQYLTHALDAAKDNSVGEGHGPVHHFYYWWPADCY